MTQDHHCFETIHSPKATAPALTLITGGARSGKSLRAEELALTTGLPLVYVAACPRGIDDEMEARITHHRESRSGLFKTVENRYDLDALAREHPGSCLLLDCLTLWLFTLSDRGLSEAEILSRLTRELEASRGVAHWIIVSSEIGLGIVPMSRESRAFRDLSGRAQQVVAKLADRVELMVAGIPMTVKGTS